MKTAVVIILAVLAQAFGNTCLSKGMKYIAAESPGGDGFCVVLIFRAMDT